MRRLLWIIAAGILIRALAAAAVPLIDDEAYYWLWARRLDWSYLDHPPIIAYLIFLTTWLGDAEVWIRLGSLLLGAATTYALFLLGRDLFGERAGLIAALLFQVLPVLAGGGLLATPDAPLFFAWTVALRMIWQALHGRPGRWTAAGLALGLGLLSKLSMALLGVGAAAFVVLYSRPWLRRIEPYRAGLLALLVFLPVIAWNVSHDWAGVRFVLYERPGGTPRGFAGIGEVIVQQFAFALLLFPLFVWVIGSAWRRRRDERFAYLLWTAAPAVAFPLAAAAARGAPHGNWLGPAYLGLAVAAGALWNRTAASLAAGNAALVVYAVAVLFVPLLPPLPGAAELYGWREAAARVRSELGALGSPAVIVADRYQVAAQLAYYTRDSVPVTLLPRPNPASIWPHPEAFAGAKAVTAVDARWTPMVDWRRFFDRVEESTPITIRFHGRPLRTLRLFRLQGLIPGPVTP